jgi:hypothetical protein
MTRLKSFKQILPEGWIGWRFGAAWLLIRLPFPVGVPSVCFGLKVFHLKALAFNIFILKMLPVESSFYWDYVWISSKKKSPGWAQELGDFVSIQNHS